ncbi:hypothetical protein [Myceligenerans crystallogenes]|uniref:Uncharacterized protein n=1 Tax=Myceligenerans crystallogenes TaxID=316335 RepID=A0ABN2NPV7_9MICO
MNVNEAKEVIDQEGLGPYTLFEGKVFADGIVIKKDQAGWLTYATSERGGLAGEIARFESESAALDNFIERLRAQREMQEIQKQRRARRRAEREEQRRAEGQSE